MITEWMEKAVLKLRVPLGVEGTLCFDPAVFSIFESAPHDVLPDFQGPPGYKYKNARGKDHPRYGRFVYAFAKHYSVSINQWGNDRSTPKSHGFAWKGQFPDVCEWLYAGWKILTTRNVGASPTFWS